jgi:hypothetical protein
MNLSCLKISLGFESKAVADVDVCWRRSNKASGGVYTLENHRTPAEEISAGVLFSRLTPPVSLAK